MSANDPAIWNAASEESTLCALPPIRVTRRSTIGCPCTPRSSWVRTPFSTLGMNCRGTAPPTTLSTNSNPPPSGRGSTSIWATAYCPCPPDCLTCRPRPPAEDLTVSRTATRTGSTATSMPARLRSRSSSTSSCCSPIVQITICSVAGLTSTRTVGSSACSLARPCTSLSSSLEDRAEIATGRRGSGITQGASTDGSAGSDRVSPVSAWASLATATMSPATAWPSPVSVEPTGTGDGAGPFVQVVLGVPVLVLRMAGEPGEVTADVHRHVGPQDAGEHPDQRTPGPRRGRWWS